MPIPQLKEYLRHMSGTKGNENTMSKYKNDDQDAMMEGWRAYQAAAGARSALRARSYAAEKLKRYAGLASYRAMLDREGAHGPEDICLIGDEGRVREAITALAAAGATDLRATELEPTPDDRARTRKLLKRLL